MGRAPKRCARMPATIREALSERIRALPSLTRTLHDLQLATGLAVHFVTPLGQRTMGSGACTLCRFLHAHPQGARQCTRFLQLLLEAAHEGPATAVCDAGLRESAVPLRMGGQTFGYIVWGHSADQPRTRPDLNRARHLLGRAGVTIDGAQLEALCADAPVMAAERAAALQRLVADIVERLVLEITENIVRPPTTIPPLVEAACRIVRAEYCGELALETVARKLNVSCGHLSRVFHQSTSLRFVEYVARVRADHARTLLRTTQRPVTEIAFACGFQSLSQFNRTMRAHFGRAPRELRRDSGSSREKQREGASGALTAPRRTSGESAGRDQPAARP